MSENTYNISLSPEKAMYLFIKSLLLTLEANSNISKECKNESFNP